MFHAGNTLPADFKQLLEREAVCSLGIACSFTAIYGERSLFVYDFTALAGSLGKQQLAERMRIE